MAITVPELGRLCAALRCAALSPVETAAFRVIFTLAFFALLRPCEIVHTGRLSHHFRLGGIQLTQHHLLITIPSSKTSDVPVTTQLVARPDLDVCPVAAMREFLGVRGTGSPDDALFVSDRQRHYQPTVKSSHQRHWSDRGS